MHAYEQVIRDVSALVAAVRPKDLDLPTPCAGWRVRQLLDHMVWENLMAASIAEDAPRTDHTADHLGDDHRAAFEDSARAALAAFTHSGMLRRTFGPYEAPGAMLVQQVVVELLAHGWDLARATGAPTVLAPAVPRRPWRRPAGSTAPRRAPRAARSPRTPRPARRERHGPAGGLPRPRPGPPGHDQVAPAAPRPDRPVRPRPARPGPALTPARQRAGWRTTRPFPPATTRQKSGSYFFTASSASTMP
ncbi:TIGR03086 family metal-binding protein [Streptomyces lydicus]|nr:TIGR03086 family metal-binding protein [Streptomyces lydicus]